jgi:hypothetical protein
MACTHSLFAIRRSPVRFRRLQPNGARDLGMGLFHQSKLTLDRLREARCNFLRRLFSNAS